MFTLCMHVYNLVHVLMLVTYDGILERLIGSCTNHYFLACLSSHRFQDLCTAAQRWRSLCLVRVAAWKCSSAMGCALPARHPALLSGGRTKTVPNAAVMGAQNAREAQREDFARWQERRRSTKQTGKQGSARFARFLLRLYFGSMCGGAGGTCFPFLGCNMCGGAGGTCFLFFPDSGRAAPLPEGGRKPWGLQRLDREYPKPMGV